MVYRNAQCIPLSKEALMSVHIGIFLTPLSPFYARSLPSCVLPSCFQITGLSSWNQRPKNFLSIILCLSEKLPRKVKGCGSTLTLPLLRQTIDPCTKNKIIKVVIRPEMILGPNASPFGMLYSGREEVGRCGGGVTK